MGSALVATSASAGPLLTSSASTSASPAAVSDGLVHHFKLDETTGTTLANSGSAGADATLVNPEKATLTGDGVRFNPDSYETALEGAHVALPDDLTAGMEELTVDYDVWVDPANVGLHQMWSFGSKSGSCDVNTGAQGSIFASNTAGSWPGARFRVAVGGQTLHQERLLEGTWKHVTYTQALNDDGTTWTGTVYIDGEETDQISNLTTPPSVNDAEGTNCNFLARSQTSGDYSFRGTLSDFRIYDRAVSTDEVAELAAETNTAGAQADAAAIDLGLTEAIVDDIVLPKFGSVAGSAITWESSDDSVVDVYTPPATAPKVDVTGQITRPAIGAADATATLTATVTKGSEVVTREIEITVKAEFQDGAAVERDAYDLDLYATDNVRGNITLADEGEFGSTITWESSAPEVVDATGVVTRPAYGHPDQNVTLTATVAKGEASQTETFEVTVKSMPRVEEMERYFLGYFKGEGIADGEQIMFATSNGNTALDWTGLTGGQPSLISQQGDQGLRDPHIVRSPDGDTFYMIATDLNWYDQGGWDINDTQYIEVFESNDLVNWTPQRHVQVAPDDAGNAFAPESLWVDEIGAYAVFWAQSLWDDPVNRTGQGNAQMWYNVTRDFQTFSEPQVWQDPAPRSRIDTTAIKVGDYYYRVTKDEAGNAGSDIFSEKHTEFLESDIDAWEMLAPALGRTTWNPNAGYEGPIIFEANPGDTACPDQFYLWGDRYTDGGGYQAACSEDIEAETWDAVPITMTNAGVPRPRHGTVIPVTLREWNDIRGIANEDVATTTSLEVDADTLVATATVEAADGFETGGEVTFTVGTWTETVLLDDGVAEITLPGDIGGGEREVTAEFLGFEILEGSQDTATADFGSEPVETLIPVDQVSIGMYSLIPWVGDDGIESVLARLAEIGFVNVEPFGGNLTGSAEDFRAMTDELGLSVPSSHYNTAEASFEDTLAYVETLGQEYVGSGGFVQGLDFDSYESTLEVAEAMNRLGVRSVEAGIGKFFGHNHDSEFTTTYEHEGQELSVWEILVDQTDPEYVTFQLDVAWAAHAGVDVPALIEAHGDRIELLHVKDATGLGEGRPTFTNLGDGDVDLQGILAAAEEHAPVAYYVLEYDVAPEGEDFATTGFEYLTGEEAGEPAPTLEVVTPAAVTFNDRPGFANDVYTIPAVEGVEYVVDDQVIEAGTYAGVGTVTVTARALEGFVLAEGATAEWSFTFVVAGPDNRPAEFHLSNTWRATTDLYFKYGRWADEVFIGDWDGDGVDTVAVRRGNLFHVTNGQGGGDADVVFRYGRPGDVVLVGDWNGDGTDSFAVRRGSQYHVKNSLSGGDADVVVNYGRDGDQVFVGDWNGDGIDTFAVRRGSQYHVKNSISGGDADVVFWYGRAEDVTHAGDWNGDGRDTFMVQRDRTFYVNDSLRGGDADRVVTFGRSGDEVYVGDWDGNGTDTLGIRRPVGPAPLTVNAILNWRQQSEVS